MKRTYLHSLPLRVWHWANTFIVITLIATGEYIRVHGIATLTPHDPFLVWHKWLGLAMIITTLAWFAYTLSSGTTRRQFSISGMELRGIFAQARFYLYGMFTGGENPFKATAEDKYNPLQKIAYLAVMVFIFPLLAVTGLLFMDVSSLRHFLLSHNLYGFIGAFHLIFAYAVVLFLIVHLYLTTLGETLFSHIKAMITGYEEQDYGDERGTGETDLKRNGL